MTRPRRVDAAVLRAHQRGRGGARRRDRGARRRAGEADVARPRAARARPAGGHRRAAADAAHARVRLQHADGGQGHRRPAAQATRPGSRAATSPTRPATSRSRRSSTPSAAPTTSRSAGTGSRRGCWASSASRTTTAWRRSRAPTRPTSGTRPSRSSSTRSATSRPSSPTRARQFFDEQLDRRARRGPGKRGGAFCSYAVPSVHPYVMLNYTSRRRDVLTLAHELGPRRCTRRSRARAGSSSTTRR